MIQAEIGVLPGSFLVRMAVSVAPDVIVKIIQERLSQREFRLLILAGDAENDPAVLIRCREILEDWRLQSSAMRTAARRCDSRRFCRTNSRATSSRDERDTISRWRVRSTGLAPCSSPIFLSQAIRFVSSGCSTDRALGPHGNYIEPELLRRVMDGYDDDYPDRARAEIAAFLVIYSQDVKEVMNSAAILLGMRDPVDPNIYDRRVDLRVYDPVLPPLWARSGKAIEDRISRAGWRRMSSLMDEIEPGLLERKVSESKMRIGRTELSL